jgi:hypothetical protein
VWRRMPVATVEEGVILFLLLLPPLQQSQTLQRSQLLLRALHHHLHQALQRFQLARQRFALTHPTGRINIVMDAIGMKKIIIDVLATVVQLVFMKEWDRR